MAHITGEMVSYGDGGLRLFFYAPETFGDFTLRAQFKIFDPAKHNSGVFLRFPNPKLDLADAELQRRASNEAAFDPNNPAWKPVITGFEVQVDDNATGDSGKDFYGIRPEPNGLYKNRTGAIYKIQAGDRIWHLNTNEPAVQNYTPGPPLIPGIWFEYEIVVQGNDYTVFLTNTQTGERKQTTSHHNTDPERGRSPGFIGMHLATRQFLHAGLATAFQTTARSSSLMYLTFKSTNLMWSTKCPVTLFGTTMRVSIID